MRSRTSGLLLQSIAVHAISTYSSSRTCSPPFHDALLLPFHDFILIIRQFPSTTSYPIIILYYYKRLFNSIPSALPNNLCSWSTWCFLGGPLSPAISNIRINLHIKAEQTYRIRTNLSASVNEIKSREARMAAPITSCIKENNTPARRAPTQNPVNPWKLKLSMTPSLSSVSWFAQISNSCTIQDHQFLVSIFRLRVVRVGLFEILKRTIWNIVHNVSAQAGI